MNRRPRHKNDSSPQQKAAPARIAVKVQPGASTNRLVGKVGDEWKITLTAPPVEGRANQACIEFLARLLGVPRSAVTIARGKTGRRKLLEIDTVQQSEVESKLDHAAQKTG